MKKSFFSIVEMIIVISIILMLIALAFPYIKSAQISSKKTATRNHLNQLKVSISSYLTDYQILPLSNHVNSFNFSDSTSVKYWNRVPDDLFQINTKADIYNAELVYDKFENSDLKINEETFKLMYKPQLLINLHSWYNGVKSPKELEDEELRTISHSSRFLNYYLSGSGFDLSETAVTINQKPSLLGNENTTFKPSTIKSGLIRNYLFAYTDQLITYNVGMKDYTPAVPDIAELSSKEKLSTEIVPVTHYTGSQTSSIFINYLPKILGYWNNQHYSSNLKEDTFRRLYEYNDQNKTLPKLTSEFSQKFKTLGSDRIINDIIFVDNRSNYSNTHIGVYMKAHTDNVKQIVDAFNTPIVYISYANQRKESARTFKSQDPKIKDISLSSDSFIVYSLGPNKTDDSDLGENHLSEKGTGDDIIEASGTTMSSEK